MDKDKVVISDYLSQEVLSNRKLFFILDEMMTDELTQMLEDYTTKTGHTFKREKCEGFWVIQKIEKNNSGKK